MKFLKENKKDLKNIFSTLKINNLNDLFNNIPEAIKKPSGFETDGLNEIALQDLFNSYAKKNSFQSANSFLGGGIYNHFCPSAVEHLASQHQFLTSYTQYQPEVSQGMLEALFEFQTFIARLTGMEFSNASHYDGATAFAEAVLMGLRKKKGRVVISKFLNPYYKDVLYTYLSVSDVKITEINNIKITENDLHYDDISVFAIESVNFLGIVENLSSLTQKAKKSGATVVVSVNILSMMLFKTPGESGADIVTGEGQSLGLPMNFGGPGFGFIAASKNWQRKIPGRLVGLTHDMKGNRGFVLTLQAREQHIRREKAVSNICTNQSSCAVKAAIFLSYYGSEKLTELALNNYVKAHQLNELISGIDGVSCSENIFFNEFFYSVAGYSAKDILKVLKAEGIDGGIDLSIYYPELSGQVLVAVTELNKEDSLTKYHDVLKEL